MNLGQLLELIGQAANRPVDGRALMDVAKDVQAGDQDDEAKMRALVRRLSALIGLKLTPEKEESIMRYLRENRFTGPESIRKLLEQRKNTQAAAGQSAPSAAKKNAAPKKNAP